MPWSEESRRKMSEARKGKNNPNYGGKSMTAKSRAKLSLAGKGRKHTEEAKAKISASHKGAANPNYGKSPSAETRAKQSESLKRAYLLLRPPTPEILAKRQAGNIRRKAKPEEKIRQCPVCGKRITYVSRHNKMTADKKEAVCKSCSQRRTGTFRKLLKDPEFQRKRVKALHARPNDPEQIIEALLGDLFPGEYKYTGNGEFIIDGLNPDFTNINGQKKVIEVFGEAFHDPKVAIIPLSKRATEDGRRKAFADFGYKMLVIWSKEIFKGGEVRRRLVKKIKEFHLS